MTSSDDTNARVPVPIMTDVQEHRLSGQINEQAVSRTVMHCEVALVLFSFDKG